MGLMGRRIVGLLGEGINEVIATTMNNAAPMGIINRGGELRMMLWKGSHTARNVENDGWLVANFIHDPMIWVRTAFEDIELDYFIEIVVNGTTMHRLRNCEAWIAFETKVERSASERLLVRLTPLAEKILSSTPRPVNRGFNSVIEATVHATRYIRTKDPTLKVLIEHHLSIVRRCGGEQELDAMKCIISFLGRIEEEARERV